MDNNQNRNNGGLRQALTLINNNIERLYNLDGETWTKANQNEKKIEVITDRVNQLIRNNNIELKNARRRKSHKVLKGILIGCLIYGGCAVFNEMADKIKEAENEIDILKKKMKEIEDEEEDMKTEK